MHEHAMPDKVIYIHVDIAKSTLFDDIEDQVQVINIESASNTLISDCNINLCGENLYAEM